jgi:hypothetical protein
VSSLVSQHSNLTNPDRTSWKVQNNADGVAVYIVPGFAARDHFGSLTARPGCIAFRTGCKPADPPRLTQWSVASNIGDVEMVEEDFTILDQVPSVVHINVGGQLFLTARETLLKVRAILRHTSTH